VRARVSRGLRQLAQTLDGDGAASAPTEEHAA
jgi:hypothetical protein